MVIDRDRSLLPANGSQTRSGTRPVSIVTVAVLGHSSRPRPVARRRGPLLLRIATAVAARNDWSSVDAVVLPGGFFRLRKAIGSFGEEERRSAVLATKAATLSAKASCILSARHSRALLVVGMDSDPVSRKVGGDHLVTAWQDGGLVSVARKTFPTHGDTHGRLPPYPVFDLDFTSPARMAPLRTGHQVLLLGCYDAFGARSIVHPRHADLMAMRLARDRTGEFHTPSIQLRRYFLARWRALILAHPPDLAFCAIHGFVRPGLDGYWQRHGIAGASAALGGIPVLAAAHFNKALPRAIDRSVLAATGIPLRHLDLGLHRRMHAHNPNDGFCLLDGDGGPLALIRRFDVQLPSTSHSTRNIS